MSTGRIAHLPAQSPDPGLANAFDAAALRRAGVALETMQETPSVSALALAEPDALLVEVTGERALAELKTLASSPETRDIPIIALIHDTDAGQPLATAAREAGAWQILPASIPPPALAASLEAWFHRGRALERAERDQAVLERTYLALLDRFSDGLLAVQNGMIVYASPAFEALIGMPRRDLIDTPADAYFDVPLPRSAAVGGEEEPAVLFIQRRLRRKDGRDVEVDLGASPIEFRKHPALQFAVRDVTFRRTLEDELLRANDELRKRHHELHEANDKLRAIFKQRTEFLNMVTHELRTSTTVISGYNRMLLGENVGSLNKQQRTFLEETRKSCDRLSNFLNNLLDIAKMDAGRMELDIGENRVRDAIVNAIRQLKPLLEERSLDVRTRISPGVDPSVFDREKIEQVLLNLLGNAIKFTSPGGTVTIQAQRVASDPHLANGAPSLQISVSDTGMGIPDSDVDTIFDEFAQAGRRSGRKGSGLGLAICRRIVEAHGGSIWAASKLQAGSTFTFSLPQSRDAAKS
jgi:PAS domain S-box-containing protein